MAYRLVVLDVDGTLVDRKQRILPENREAIERFRRAGGLVTLGTGRIEQSARPFLEGIGANAPAILYNGARIVKFPSERVLMDKRLPPAVGRALLNLLETRFLRLNPILYCGGRPLVRAITPTLAQSARKDGLVYEPVDALGNLLSNSFNKALIIGGDKSLTRLDAALREAAPTGQVNTVRSEPNYLEVLPVGASKGAALRRLAEMLKIPLSEVIAIGDNLNDLEMIQAAGLGVAVANAHPGLKAAADLVLPYTNEQAAVAHVLERFCQR